MGKIWGQKVPTQILAKAAGEWKDADPMFLCDCAAGARKRQDTAEADRIDEILLLKSTLDLREKRNCWQVIDSEPSVRVKRARWTKADQSTFECEVNSGNYKGGRVGRMRSHSFLQDRWRKLK